MNGPDAFSGVPQQPQDTADTPLPEPKNYEVRAMVAQSLANTIDQILAETEDAERTRKLNRVQNDLGIAAVPEENEEADQAFGRATGALLELGVTAQDELDGLIARTRKYLMGEA